MHLKLSWKTRNTFIIYLENLIDWKTVNESPLQKVLLSNLCHDIGTMSL